MDVCGPMGEDGSKGQVCKSLCLGLVISVLLLL